MKKLIIISKKSIHVKFTLFPTPAIVTVQAVTYTIRVLNFEGLNFCDLGSQVDLVGLYFHG